MLTPTGVTHPCDAFGYPRGARGQNDPRAIMLHITDSNPTNPPLVSLDNWFGRWNANGGTQLGIQDHVVHRYIRDKDAAWGGGYMDRPDLTNENVKRWWDLRINPNTEAIHIEVVRKPGPRPVARGTHLVSGATWKTIKTVCGELVTLHPKIELVAADFLGHFQVDRVNRSRDPINAYWPEDVLFDIREDSRRSESAPELEEDDMKPFLVWDRDRKRIYLVGPWGATWITTAVDVKKFEELYGKLKVGLSKATLDALDQKVPKKE